MVIYRAANACPFLGIPVFWSSTDCTCPGDWIPIIVFLRAINADIISAQIRLIWWTDTNSIFFIKEKSSWATKACFSRIIPDSWIRARNTLTICSYKRAFAFHGCSIEYIWRRALFAYLFVRIPYSRQIACHTGSNWIDIRCLKRANTVFSCDI